MVFEVTRCFLWVHWQHGSFGLWGQCTEHEQRAHTAGLTMEARCSQKTLRRGSQKTFKTCVILPRLWGPNVVPNGAQHMYLFEGSGVPGPDWAHRALGVDSESQNGGSKCSPKCS